MSAWCMHAYMSDASDGTTCSAFSRGLRTPESNPSRCFRSRRRPNLARAVRNGFLATVRCNVANTAICPRVGGVSQPDNDAA